MIWRGKHSTNVQARTVSTVYSSYATIFLSKDCLSLSISESEPGHPRVQSMVYTPIISEVDLIDFLSAEERYRRLKDWGFVD